MDHSTCVAFTVGRRDLEAQSVGKKSLEEQGTIRIPRDVALSFYSGKGQRDGPRPTPNIQISMYENSQQLRLVCRVIYADTLNWTLSEQSVLLTVTPPALDTEKVPGESFVPFLEDDFSQPLSRTVPLPCPIAGPSSGIATPLDPCTAVILLDKK